MRVVEAQPEDSSGHRREVAEALHWFRQEFLVTYVIAVLGGAKQDNLIYAHAALSELMRGLRGTTAAVLTGGTKGGIPELAITLARENDLPTLAVRPPSGAKYALDKVDLVIQTPLPSVGSGTFATETPTLTRLPDYAIVFGGGDGTAAEVTTIGKFNSKRVKDGQEPVRVLPIEHSGGVASVLQELGKVCPGLALGLMHEMSVAQILTFIDDIEGGSPDIYSPHRGAPQHQGMAVSA